MMLENRVEVRELELLDLQLLDKKFDARRPLLCDDES